MSITLRQRTTINKTAIFLCIMLCTALDAKEAEEPEIVEQLQIGNFAVSGTTQPGPLLGFGQNIISQYDALGMAYFTWILGKNKKFNDVFPYLLYGIRDDLSLVLVFPTALSFNADGHHSSGSEDMIVQFEYAFYSHHMKTMTNQFTFVTSLYLPTGNECKNPSTGFGAPSFFLGVTAEHFSIDWYYYTSYAALITTHYDNSKSGNQFFYQAGIGRNIAYKTEKWTLLWMVEFFGWYEQKAKVDGVVDPNSGFNMFIVCPSLWFSTERFILQAGAGPVASQHLFGIQDRFSSVVSIGVGCKFN